MKTRVNVNGFVYEAFFSEEEMTRVIVPLLETLTALQRKRGERIIVFLAAPPAVGKTTLAVFLEKIAKEDPRFTPVQHLSLDGFHHTRAYLQQTTAPYDGKQIVLNTIKGMPETFDHQKFLHYLARVKTNNDSWPIYDREIHDVIENQVTIHAEIILIEGNWLLLDEPEWNRLVDYCDYSIFIEADERALKNRLIERKMKGGLSYDDAVDFYERSDHKNIDRVLNHRLDADMVLSMDEHGEKRILKNAYWR